VTEELRRQGHDVVVATSYNHIPGPPDPQYIHRCMRIAAFAPNMDIVPYSIQAFQAHVSILENVHNLARIARQFIPDAILFWNLNGIGGLHLIDFANTVGVPWGIYLGDGVFEHIVNAAPKMALSIFGGDDPNRFAGGAIMAVSQTLVDEICDNGNFRFPRPPELVYGYVKLDETPLQPRQYRRNGNIRFMAASYVAEHKGTKIICDAAREVMNQGLSDFHIDIYGQGELSTFVSLVDSLGLSDRITFHGPVDQNRLQVEFSEHDAFLFPTWEREPFAFVPFEAAAFGCVPILTANCGCSERIVHNVHGIKIERSAVALAAAMTGVMRRSIPIERIGRAAAQMVRSDMTLTGHVEKILRSMKTQVRQWNPARLDDPRLNLLTFMKHNLALDLIRDA
jgi:glycosyltransferase involved in cell wall biosynthesis